MGYLNVATSFAATAEAGRIVLPSQSQPEKTAVGLQKLSGGKGLLYVPTSYRANEVLPLLVLLHKSGGSRFGVVCRRKCSCCRIVRGVCREGRFIILAPEAPGPSWGHRAQRVGVTNIWQSIAPWKRRFARCAIDRNKLAIAGFSDGASYALSLGLANGDVFSYVIAFSPGFIVRAQARGRPSLFIAHGLTDNVLPITSTSRVFVTSLRKNGYNVEFREFSGGHHASPQVADQAMSWLTAAFRQRRWETQDRQSAQIITARCARCGISRKQHPMKRPSIDVHVFTEVRTRDRRAHLSFCLRNI